MTRWQRALLGALLGALAVLFLHPATRPMYLSVLRLTSSEVLRTSPLVTDNVRSAPQPETLDIASLWMVLAAEKEMAGSLLAPADRDKMVEVALRSADRDPRNAFWHQMAAYWAWDRNQEEALRYWLRASRGDTWNDRQTPRLRALQAALAAESGGRLAWHAAESYRERSNDPAQLVLEVGRRVMDLPGADTDKGLELRAATIRNGVLMRGGSKSVGGGLLGVSLVEWAARPATLRMERSNRKLLIARYALLDQMRAAGMEDDALATDVAFRENDAWTVLLDPDSTEEHRSGLAFDSVFSGSLPGALAITSLIGVLLWVWGTFLDRWPKLALPFTPALAPWVGAALGLGVYSLTDLVVPSVFAALSIAFYVYRPKATRSAEPRDFGPLYSLTLAVLAMVFGAFIALFFVSSTAGARTILPFIDIPTEFFGPSWRLIGFSLLVFGLFLLVPPAWGLAQRYDPQRLLGPTFRRFGLWVCVWSATLSVVLGPICLAWDESLGTNLRMLVDNEPLYYHNR